MAHVNSQCTQHLAPLVAPRPPLATPPPTPLQTLPRPPRLHYHVPILQQQCTHVSASARHVVRSIGTLTPITYRVLQASVAANR